VLSAVSSELTDSLTKFSLGSTAALGAVNCVGRWITGDENFDMVAAGLNAAVQGLLGKIPTSSLDELPVFETEACFDMYKASVGEGCLCSVGCARREEDASCAPKDGSANLACKTGGTFLCFLLAAWSSLLSRI
ncbi:unnamed protein product, partial [Symbiodinium necroappetens]